MSRKRKCQFKNLSDHNCKLSRASRRYNAAKRYINNFHEENSSEILNELGEELIEISSEESMEKWDNEKSRLENMDSDNSSDVVILENNHFEILKPSLFESIKTINLENSKSNSNVPEDSPQGIVNIISSNSNVTLLKDSFSGESENMNINEKSLESGKFYPVSPLQDIFYVEKILDMKVINGKRIFYLKWEGFSDSENTWEPEENIEPNLMVQEFLGKLEKDTQRKLINIELESENSELNIECSNLLKSVQKEKDMEDIVFRENNFFGLISRTENCKLGETIDITSYGKNKNVCQKSMREEDIIIQEDLSYQNIIDMGHNDSAVILNINNNSIIPSIKDDQIQTEEKIGINITAQVEVKPLESENPRVTGNLMQYYQHKKLNDKEWGNINAKPKPNIMKKKSKINSSGNQNKIFKKKKFKWIIDKKKNSKIKNMIAENFSNKEIPMISSVYSKSLNDRNIEVSTEANVKSPDIQILHEFKSNKIESTELNNQWNILAKVIHTERSRNLSVASPIKMCETTKEIFMVEKILKMKIINGARKFLLKWEGFPDSENSWEPEENLACPDLIKEFLNGDKERKRRKKKIQKLLNKDSSLFQEIETDVYIKEPFVKVKDFTSFREADCILAAGMINNQLMFLIKCEYRSRMVSFCHDLPPSQIHKNNEKSFTWKNIDMANLVSARRANLECPQAVIRFYEQRLNWKNSDNSITTEPKENFKNPITNHVSKKSIKEKTMDSVSASLDKLISMVNGKLDQFIKKHPVKSGNFKAKKLTPGSKLINKLKNKIPNFSPKPEQKLSSDKTPQLTTKSFSSSGSIMNLIKSFRNHKSNNKPSFIDLPKMQSHGFEKSIDRREYDSRLISQNVIDEKINFSKPSEIPKLKNINDTKPDLQRGLSGHKIQMTPEKLNFSMKSGLVSGTMSSTVVPPNLYQTPNVNALTSWTKNMPNINNCIKPTSINPHQIPPEMLNQYFQIKDPIDHNQISWMSANLKGNINESMPKAYLSSHVNKYQPISDISSQTSIINRHNSLNNLYNSTNSSYLGSTGTDVPKSFDSINNFTSCQQDTQSIFNNRNTTHINFAPSLHSPYQNNSLLIMQPETFPLMSNGNSNNGAFVIHPSEINSSNSQYEYVINQSTYNATSGGQYSQHHQYSHHHHPVAPVTQNDNCLVLPAIENFTVASNRNQQSMQQIHHNNQPRSEVMQKSYWGLRENFCN